MTRLAVDTFHLTVDRCDWRSDANWIMPKSVAARRVFLRVEGSDTFDVVTCKKTVQDETGRLYTVMAVCPIPAHSSWV